jgi:hypothetical protein
VTDRHDKTRMELSIDPDVRAVIEFMQGAFSASRLIGIARGVAAFAPILWDVYPSDQVRVAELRSIAFDAGQIPPSAT